jgi:hypothetical protein
MSNVQVAEVGKIVIKLKICVDKLFSGKILNDPEKLVLNTTEKIERK